MSPFQHRSRFLKSITALAAIASLWLISTTNAWAQATPTPPGASPNPFTSPPDSDRAFAWIDFLFSGTPMPDGMAAFGQSLAPLANGMQHAIGLYNFGMLVVGAMLLFYHIIGMVVDTAHSGVILGRRANKVWAPIRLVIAIGLLFPIGGGLSAGQYLVIKIAKTGSELASNAWQTVVSLTGDTLSAVATPRPPNVAALVTNTIEMELCRLAYTQAYTQAYATQAASDGPTDTSLPLAGTITDIAKLPADRLMPETWRYSNALNTTIPLCGEYHFSGYRPFDWSNAEPDKNASDIERVSSSLFAFAHLEASELLNESSNIASRIAPAFLTPGTAPAADIRNDLATLISTTEGQLNDKMKTIGLTDIHLGSQVVERSADAGWIAAADIIPEVIRVQESYGEAISHALPTAAEPVFDHPLLAKQAMFEALNSRPPLFNQQAENTREYNLVVLYNQVARIMSLAHTWLNGSQLPKDELAPASSLDLRDHLSISTDAGTAFGLFAAAFDTQAITEGVWGTHADGHDTGNPFISPPTTLNPFAVLAEFGRRQYHLGIYMLGLSGSSLGSAGAIAPATMTALAAAALFIGGLGLVFVVPFLPLFRFMIAVMVWALNVFEAVAAMPVVAIAHLTPTGEGLSGSTARQAYRLWLGLMIRPLLTLMGLVLGLLFFTAAIGFFAAALTPFAHVSSTANSSLLIVANVALTLMFDLFAYVAVNVSFKGIYWLPENALRWISTFTVTESNEPDSMPATASSVVSALAAAPAAIANMMSSSTSSTNSANIGGSMSVHQSTTTASTKTSSAGGGDLNPMKSSMFPSYQGSGGGGKPEVVSVSLTTPNVTINLQDRNKGSQTGGAGIRAPQLPSVSDKLMPEKPVDVRAATEEKKKKQADEEQRKADEDAAEKTDAPPKGQDPLN